MISAGLLIFGIIIGVLFYDVLVRKWGFQEYTDKEITDKLGVTTNGEVLAPEADDTTVRVTEQAPGSLEPDGIKAPDASALLEEWEKSGEIRVEAEKDIPDIEAEKTVQTSEPEEETGAEQVTSDYKSYTVKGAGANVRSGPGMNHEIVTVVKGGQQFKATGERQGRWYKIIAPDGKEGWISGKIITEVK